MWEWLMAMFRKKKYSGKATLRGTGTIRATGQVYQATIINYTGEAALSSYAVMVTAGAVALSGEAAMTGTGENRASAEVFAPVMLTGQAYLFGVGNYSSYGEVPLMLTGRAYLVGQGATQSAGFIPVVSLAGAATIMGTAECMASGNVQAPVLLGYGLAPYDSGFYGG